MVGILTFHWADDCGAMLQAFALKTALEKTGESAVIIPYAPYRLTVRYWWLPFSVKVKKGRNIYRPNIRVWLSHIRSTAFYSRRCAMRRFRRDFLTKQKPIRRPDAVSLENFSCVFVGSDQVWNPDITIGLDDVYLGNITEKGNCRIVSYAASFGGSRIRKDAEADFAEAVKQNFSAVSLREPSAVPFVEERLGIHAESVLDPVLLLDRKEWENVGSEVTETGYILVYRVEQNQDMYDYITALSRTYGFKIVTLSVPTIEEQKRGWQYPKKGVGPAEFIGYLRNADCVVTNSFHATAFSVLMQKSFISFCHSSRNARLDDLLTTVGLRERMTDGKNIPDIFAGQDWDAVRSRLEEARKKSERFILEQLGG